MRILIAEDDLTSRSILENVLKQWGHEVVSTEDGAEAWAVLQGENPPPMAILDWMMPGMNGPDICRNVQALRLDTPPYIILLTSLGGTENVIDGLSAGANDYLTKPFKKEELEARIGVGERVVELEYALFHRINELQTALSHVETLQGILPICMYCHKIRNDKESWERIESYIQEHSEAKFSHSLCPECLEKHYPEIAAKESKQAGGE